MSPTDNLMRTAIPEIEQSTVTTTKPCHDDALVVKQTQFQIREYVPDDYDDVAQLVSDGLMFYGGEGSPHHAYWVLFVQNSLTTDVADISGHYLREGNTFFVVTTTTPSGETVTVGTIGVEKISDSVAELRRVSVKDAYRRFGIGKFMMARVSEWAKARRYATFVLSCAEVQTQARRFYESLGYAFTKTSVRHEGNESMVLTHYEKSL
uniref:N-acetyltransferase domain-containing protein n=1 Tax=Globisporangium ultimum (strain ATCC 200006 / CBS 805.95 / DAOM BR144) TaxID=431595 RepID=K3XAR4_GLOUD